MLKLTKQLKEDIISPKDKVAIWAKFIINPNMLEEKEMDDNEEIRKANEILDDIQKDEHERYLAHLRLKYILDKNSGEQDSYDKGMEKGLKQGLKKGRERGKSEGIKENQKEVVINLYNMQMKVEDICKAVNLTKEEVEKIIEESK